MALRLIGGFWRGLILKFGFLFFGAGLSREFKINQHKVLTFTLIFIYFRSFYKGRKCKIQQK